MNLEMNLSSVNLPRFKSYNISVAEAQRDTGTYINFSNKISFHKWQSHNFTVDKRICRYKSIVDSIVK